MILNVYDNVENQWSDIISTFMQSSTETTHESDSEWDEDESSAQLCMRAIVDRIMNRVFLLFVRSWTGVVFDVRVCCMFVRA